VVAALSQVEAMGQSSISGDGHAVSSARVVGDLRCGMSFQGDT
jgi:hypothetical protein